jgi:predicted RNA-binding Zn ribbon-like protein
MVKNSELIQAFVNTRDLLDDEEALATPAALGSWCEAHGLLGGDTRPTPADLRHALELREALRSLLLGNNGVEVDLTAANAALDQAVRRARVELRFEDGRAALVPGATGIPAALGRIAVAVHGAMADGSWERLKACRADDCLWVFVDEAKNRSRAWCSMSSCGNRAKARSYRERHRTAGS